MRVATLISVSCARTWAGWVSQAGPCRLTQGAVMPQQRGRGLSQAEWLALCLISEGPTHGFAIAGLLAQDGSLGHVWHVQKTVIYRAVRRLAHLGLITVSPKQPNRLGPEKAQLQVTPDGRQAAEGWLRRPAGHHRDIRSELLVKLALLDRAGVDPRDLLLARVSSSSGARHAGLGRARETRSRQWQGRARRRPPAVRPPCPISRFSRSRPPRPGRPWPSGSSRRPR